MPTHYVYKEPDALKLFQGDILCKTEDLVAHLKKYHPYYAQHTDYKYFMVLTQSCDLYRRGGSPASSRYITLAAVRPVEEVLRREAQKSQLKWQQEVGAIGSRANDKLKSFLESLFDNNKDGYFYVHSDLGLGIQYDCCAILQLSVALKIEHYEMCLAAKIAQLRESFQAKLGHLLGDMSNRVGTTEWNDNYPDNKVSDAAKALLDKTFVTYDDNQIKEGLADLKAAGTLQDKSAAEIRDYIYNKKIIPRKQKFQQQALKVLDTIKPIDLIRGRIETPLQTDGELRDAIDGALNEAGVDDTKRDAIRDKLTTAFLVRLRQLLSDGAMPGKSDVLKKILAKLLSDSLITAIMK